MLSFWTCHHCSETTCDDAVFLQQLPRHLVVCRLGLGWRMRSNPDNVLRSTQTTPHSHTESRQVEHTIKKGHTTQLCCKDARINQKERCYNLVNEQAQSEPQRLHARHQGTPSPQISSTFRTLYLRTNHLAQRSSPEGSLVHVHRCS